MFVNIDKNQVLFLTCRNGVNDGRIIVDINYVEKLIIDVINERREKFTYEH